MKRAGSDIRRLAITVGDFNGIGPEVVLKSISDGKLTPGCAPVLVGPVSVFRHYSHGLRRKIKFQVLPSPRLFSRRASPLPRAHGPVLVLDTGPTALSIRPGAISARAGAVAAEAVERAVQLALMGIVDAIVTSPVSKRAMHLAGIRYAGQTEMLQHLTGAPRVGMMLVGPSMRVGLVTLHLPLSEVAHAITPRLLADRIKVYHHALITDWGIAHPRIAVLGLNPHAGENGDLGTQEQRVIEPVLRSLRRAGMQLDGPFAADAFWAKYRQGTVDAVIAMYHDQGLIPLKMTSFQKGVNVTVGLPIVRTSPDHGTAFDIAGTGRADPGSMIQAITLAVQIAAMRKRQTQGQHT